MVFLFIPNIIGYIRFGFLLACLATFQNDPCATVILYGLSQFMDMLDGKAARMFNQATDFGAVLDMVCDRASNGIMLAILGSLYPQFAWIFYGDIALDLVSHWYQMAASLMSRQHHKKAKTSWKLLHLYYNNSFVLFTLVAGNEIFLLLAYINAHYQRFLITRQQQNKILIPLIYASFALFLIKKLMSVIQLISASQKIAKLDRQRIGNITNDQQIKEKRP